MNERIGTTMLKCTKGFRESFVGTGGREGKNLKDKECTELLEIGTISV